MNSFHTLEEVIARLRMGFYPYYDRDNNAFYWDRDEVRSVLELTPRLVKKAASMLASIKENYRIAWNKNPDLVIAKLRDKAIKEESWVNDEVQDIYQLLNAAGHLATVEAYDSSGELCGALLGMRLGNAFMAETMYHVRRNASKACLCNLVLKLAQESVPFVDVQVSHQAEHPVRRLGETTIPLQEYLRRLHEATSGFDPLPLDIRHLMKFPDARSRWANSHPLLIDGRRGKTLYLCGFQMVQDWETPLLSKMGKAVSHRGARVLEIGFGLGISASAVQSQSPCLHVIVEANKETADTAKRQYAGAVADGRVVVVEGFWQDVIANWPDNDVQTNCFDGIVFDPYPLVPGEIRQPSFEFFHHAVHLLAPGGRFTYYSDESISLTNQHASQLQRYFPDCKIITEQIQVQPWPECEYWEDVTMLHVVVEKKAADES